MFKSGDIHKVKVELPDGDSGFGRAKVVQVEGSRFWVQLNSSGALSKQYPSGTHLRFVNDRADDRFNGMWSTTIVGERIVEGHTAFECTSPKFTPVVEQRKHPRITFTSPVWLSIDQGGVIEVTAKDISRGGICLEAKEDDFEHLQLNSQVHITIQNSIGDIAVICRVARKTSNWLMNTCEIGLEFGQIPEVDKQNLINLLTSLGYTETAQGQAQALSESQKLAGLSNFLKGNTGDKSLIGKDANKETSKDAATDPRRATGNLRSMQSKMDKLD
jgi:hypothetical protein